MFDPQNIENSLNSLSQTIDSANFSEKSLQILEKHAELLRNLLLDLELGGGIWKLTAIGVYTKILEKLEYFAGQVKDKVIVPNDKELKSFGEIVGKVNGIR